MKKILRLQSALLKEIDKYEKLVPAEERDHFIDWERIHIVSCAKIGYMMGQERGLDPVLAACTCACHDYGRIVNGKQKDHAEAGYLPVQKFLRGTGLFTETEISMMAEAVKNHSRKDEIGTPLEELVKDADVVDFCQYGYGMVNEGQKMRAERLLGSDGIWTPARHL